jgi:hypothetical protein
MLVSVKFYEIKFTGEDKGKIGGKQAYMKLIEWLAKHVISKVEVGENTQYAISKVKDADYPTYRLELFCTLKESDIQAQRCEVCKEFHKAYYINQEYNCNECKMKSYVDLIKQKLSIKRSYRKERIEWLLEDN